MRQFLIPFASQSGDLRRFRVSYTVELVPDEPGIRRENELNEIK